MFLWHFVKQLTLYSIPNSNVSFDISSTQHISYQCILPLSVIFYVLWSTVTVTKTHNNHKNS